jgi:hypothetical protein
VFSHPFRLTYLARPRRGLFHPIAGAVLLLTALALAFLPGAAQASSGCPATAVSEPFSQWGDANSYELVAEGDFEGSLSEWTFGGGAGTATGSEPYAATGAAGKASLALPAGSSAQSPFTCVTASDPTFRFFARGDAPLSVLTAAVVYKTLLGALMVPLGVVAAGETWQPTAPMLTASVLAGLLSGGTAELALRFTELTGASQIDDVFIDPRMR